MPANLGSSLGLNLLNLQASFPAAPRMEAAHAANPSQAEDCRPAQDSSLPDTFTSWGDLARPEARHANGLPPFPSQCLMSPPPPPSTAASSQLRYLKPFAGKGLQTLSGASAPRQDARRPEPSDAEGRAEESRDAQAAAPDNSPPGANDTPEAAAPSRGPSENSSYQKLADRVDAHEQRLDRLEGMSFSVAGHEDCHEKHEHIDLRVTELESRVEEVEKALNDNGSVASGRRAARQDAAADDTTASVVSVSTNATVRASDRSEVYSQLQALQAQVNQLQAAALPTYTKPWEVEVVFLPFPLKGIWMEARDFPAHRRSTGSNVDDWTQMPNTISRSTPDPQSPRFQEWAGQGPDSNWLLPRAFAPGRIIDQRLKSRGLIKTVLVRGADARSVQLAIHHAFGDILRISSNVGARAGDSADYPLAGYLGLRQPWVPLRKLHKDSRLRFLSPAEMATPALWDFTFLVSSVVMRATGIHRLYITQPEAYLQDHPLGYQAVESGWTWQKLRELSRVYPDSQSSAGDVPEADAMEACWAWNDRLDEPPSARTSVISLRHSHQQRASGRSSTEPSQQFYTGVESPSLSNTTGFVRAQSPLIQRDRKGSWPPNVRAGSVPPGAPPLLSPAQSRRRVSSHAAGATPYERRPSPFVSRASPRPGSRVGTYANATAVPKRRFRTRSPSLAPRNTPRWSRSPSVAPGGPYGYHEDRNRERRTTPFYYATPHSEAIPEPYGYHRAGSRGPPAVLRTNGYDPDDDEDMNDDDGYDDPTSSTDPYDSEMTSDAPGGGGPHGPRRGHNSSFGFGTDGDDADLDIDVYEDEDELDGVDTDAGNNHDAAVWHGFGRKTEPPSSQLQQQQQQALRPEDIPWAGIEDAEENDQNNNNNTSNNNDDDNVEDSNMSDAENTDPNQSQEITIHEDEDVDILDDDDDDDDDDSSEAPSEYSSRPGAWQMVAASAAGGGKEGRAQQKQRLQMQLQMQMQMHAHQARPGSGLRMHRDDGSVSRGGDGDGDEDGETLLDTQWG